MSDMNTIAVRVTHASRLAQDIRLLELAPVDGGMLPAFEAGSHIDLHLGPSLVRQYSLCNAPGPSASYRVAVKREEASRGGSRAVHERLAVGSQLDISMPRNHFPMAARAKHSLLVAGGIGITPLMAMAQALVAKGESFELLYFCRSHEHAAFLDILQSAAFAPHCRFLFGLDREGVSRALKDALVSAGTGTHLYTCGPRPFMDTVTALARESLEPDNVHLEYFSADAAVLDGPSDGFEVRLARTGKTFAIAPAETIADTLRLAGIDVETSCEQGICGTCVTDVLEGTPDHRDCFLSDAEKAQGRCMAICVSRSLTPVLVLDI